MAKFSSDGRQVCLTQHRHGEVARLVHEGRWNVRKHSGAHRVIVAVHSRWWTVDRLARGRRARFLLWWTQDAIRARSAPRGTAHGHRARQADWRRGRGGVQARVRFARGNRSRILPVESMITSVRTDVIRIGIADDHPIFRDGLRRLLEIEPDMVVVGDVENAAPGGRVRTGQTSLTSCSWTWPCRLSQVSRLSGRCRSSPG